MAQTRYDGTGSIRILTKDGVENTNIDGAREYNSSSGGRSGIIKDVLNEGRLYKVDDNRVVLDTCELRLCGHRIVIESPQYFTFVDSPSGSSKDYHIIANLYIETASTNPSFYFSVESDQSEYATRKDNVNNGKGGLYQFDLGRVLYEKNSSGKWVVSNVYQASAPFYGGGNVIISQALGDDEKVTISQKVITENINEVKNSLTKKLDLIEPSAAQTEFVMVQKSSDGTVKQVQEVGMFTPQTLYETYTPVLRGLQGQLRGQTAPLADQVDLDLINRAELTEKLNDKLNASNTPGIVYGNTNDGSISEPTEIPYTPYLRDEGGESIVSRTYDGYFDVKVPVQDLHPVNKKYGDDTYEKSPHYVLIEKIITGYSLLPAAPSDFATNYASYYKTNGKARNDIDFNYVALTETPTAFEEGKYYYKTTDAAHLNRYGESGKEPDGTAYAFKNLFIDIENSDATFGAWASIHFYGGNRALGPLYYGGLGVGANSNRSAVNADVQGNAVNAYAMALTTENTATKLQFRKTEIISGTSVVLDGIKITNLPADTTVLIYGVRI